jgi:putative ABC transport system substrate-binding protein
MRRRTLLVAVGSIIIGWTLAARAEERRLPVVGVLGSDSPDLYADRLRALRQGLKETGYIEGENLAIDYRWPSAGGNDELPALAADLVRRHVSVIVALGSTPAAVAAKAATTTIPIVFFIGYDPIQVGLVTSLSRPGGNITGGATLNEELVSKRMELLHEVLPGTTSMALLVNPKSPNLAEVAAKEAHAAARNLGIELDVLQASTERDLDTAFTAVAQQRAGALVIAGDAFFISRSEQLAALALRSRVPAIFQYRSFVASGGLMSYGPRIEVYSLAGIYTGRILSGEKPADLPVQQITQVELIINLKAAKTLSITIPAHLLARADELIE